MDDGQHGVGIFAAVLDDRVMAEAVGETVVAFERPSVINIEQIEIPLRRGVADQIQFIIEVEDPTNERCRQQCGRVK